MTANERAAVLQFGQHWLWSPPFPDGALGHGDRAHLLHLFPFSPAVEGGVPACLHIDDAPVWSVAIDDFVPWIVTISDSTC